MSPRDGDRTDARSPVPDVPGVVIGWRTWSLVEDPEPVLVSPVRPGRWPARRAMTALCEEDHAAPTEACACGLYAALEVRTALEVGGEVLGCVALWGQVLEGDAGWRATSAYPSFLITGPGVDAASRDRLAEAYGVPVHGVGVSPRALVVVGRHGRGAQRRDELAARSETVREALASSPTPLAVAQSWTGPSSSGATGPLSALLEVMRPGALPLGAGAAVFGLLGLCLLPDLWIGALAWILGWVDESFWRQTLGFALVLGLVWLARRPLWRLAQFGWRRLRSSALAGLGGAGAVLWRACAVPVALACVMQLVAVWELHAHDDPRWLPGVLVAPALVACLTGIAWVAARIRPQRPRRWQQGWALAGLAAVVVLVAAGAVFWASSGLGADLEALDEPTGYWDSHVGDNGPPGRCLSSRPAFWSGEPSGAIVSCSDAHWGELLGYADLGPPAPYPGDEQASAQAGFACARLQAAQGLSPAEFETSALYPGPERWAATPGDPYAACALERRDGALLSPGIRSHPTPVAPDQPATMDLYGDQVADDAPIGSCAAEKAAVDADIHDAPVVTCDRPHWARVVGYPVIAAPGEPWPGDDEVARRADAACAALPAERGLPAGTTSVPQTPDPDFWRDMAPRGAHIVCLVARSDGRTSPGPVP